MAGFQAQWADDEFAGIDLNDKRLNTRVVTIATQLGTIAESSWPVRIRARNMSACPTVNLTLANF